MAITKRMTVKFDLKIVFDSVEVEHFTQKVLNDSKRFLNGEKLNGLELEAARIAAEYGVEAAVELLIKASMKEALVTVFSGKQETVGNVSTVFKQ